MSLNKQLFTTLFSAVLLYNTNIYAEKGPQFEEENSPHEHHSSKLKKRTLKKEEKSFLEKHGKTICIVSGFVIGAILLYQLERFIQQKEKKNTLKELKVFDVGDRFLNGNGGFNMEVADNIERVFQFLPKATVYGLKMAYYDKEKGQFDSETFEKQPEEIQEAYRESLKIVGLNPNKIILPAPASDENKIDVS